MDGDADEPAAPRNDALAAFEWLGDAFIVMRSELAGEPAWDFVFGHNDPRNTYVVLHQR